jgi:hypothetical protein
MGWSSGVYTKGNSATGGWTGDAASGIGIEAGRHDTQDNDFATGINTCLTKDGQNTPTANLPMGGFKHTGVANGSARTDYAAVGQVQDGDFVWLGTTGGTATAQTVTASPSIGAYKAGQKFRMKVGAGLGSTGSSATAHTLNINSLGAKNIVNNEDSTNPTLGTWIAGAILEVVYDGTNFIITNDPGGWLSYTPTFSVSAGGTSGETIQFALYRKQAKTVYLQLYYTWTQTTVPAPVATVGAPINAATVNQSIGALGYLSGASVCGVGYFTSASGIAVSNYNNSSFAIGTANVFINGIYRSV